MLLAGLFGVFLIRDSVEDSLNLPKGKYEIPLVIYDRMFDEQSQLYYPVSPDPKAPWIPEFFGDAILVNGKLFPYLEVEPRKYRFRVLNGANSRFFHLSLSNGQSFSSDRHGSRIAASSGLPRSFATRAQRASGLDRRFCRSRRRTDCRQERRPSRSCNFEFRGKKCKDPSSLPSTLRPVLRIPESEAIKTRMLPLVEIDDRGPESCDHVAQSRSLEHAGHGRSRPELGGNLELD